MTISSKQHKLAVMLHVLEDFDAPVSSKQWKWYMKKFPPEVIDAALMDEHEGDCTQQCQACNRCLWEGYMNNAKWILDMLEDKKTKHGQ